MSSHICDYYMWLDVQSNRILLFKLSFMFRNIDLNLIRKCFFFFPTQSAENQIMYEFMLSIVITIITMKQLKCRHFVTCRLRMWTLASTSCSLWQSCLCVTKSGFGVIVFLTLVFCFSSLSRSLFNRRGQSVIVFISCSRPVRVIANDCLSHK